MVRVWIDQDLCTGDGLCAEIEPSIFEMHEDGLAYVKEAPWPSITNNGSETQDDPFLQMAEGTALVPEPTLDAVIEAADDCPGECIYLDVES